MPSYKAPLQDMQFIINDVIQIEQLLLELPYYQEIDADLFEPILEEAAKFSENILQPTNQIGDQQGCQFNNGEVSTPKGFKEAYQQFVAGGWLALNAAPEHGGQGLPKMIQVLLDEMLCSANVSFSLYTVLTQGTVSALIQYGSDALKQIYLAKLVSGEWGGTMCLTESHCGTDLGMLRTKAIPQEDGTYKITGTKIFITSGEHDLTDNIIHTVLARLPDAPDGVKGISMFLVPKHRVNADGSIGAKNGVSCGSIEHKMGIKGSSTCVMNFEDACGFLLGEKNQGMRAMFSMMNLERLNIGLEGLGLSEVSYQNAQAYAKDRIQGRAPSGSQNPEKAADPIIVHPDVRRMLLTMKAYNEGARAMAAFVAKHVDIAKHHPDKQCQHDANELVAFLTPVIKAFFTDCGFENCNLGLQVLGGHGYVSEWGMEQFVRDARIAQIYEGTNGVQALDLVKRKLVANKGQALNYFSELITNFIQNNSQDEALAEFTQPLTTAVELLANVSDWIMQQALKNPAEAGAAATEYLRLLGLVSFAFMWAKMAKAALAKLNDTDVQFYQTKIKTARFFYQRLLPQIHALQRSIQAGSNVLMDLDESEF